MPYFIGDEPSSSNYRPGYCNNCDADTPDECRCSPNRIQESFKKCGRYKESDQDNSCPLDFSGGE